MINALVNMDDLHNLKESHVDGNNLIVTPTLIKICNKTKVERAIRVYFKI